MAAKNPKAGRGSCPTCSASVVFRRSPATGKLAFSCDECDSSGYADKGSAADAKWSATIASPAPAPGPAATPAAAPSSTSAPAPAAKKTAKPFSLEGL